MKSPLIIILTLFSIVFVIVSCEHDAITIDNLTPCELESIKSDVAYEGTWLWIKSIGGFGGWTITPETEGYNIMLLINENSYTEFRNCTITHQMSYTIIIDSLYGTYGYLDLDPGGHLGVEVRGDSLQLIEPCCDGYDHYYKRK